MTIVSTEEWDIDGMLLAALVLIYFCPYRFVFR